MKKLSSNDEKWLSCRLFKQVLTGLWNANKKDGHMLKPKPIDIAAAQHWTRQELLTRIHTANHQLNLEGR